MKLYLLHGILYHWSIKQYMLLSTAKSITLKVSSRDKSFEERVPNAASVAENKPNWATFGDFGP
jgi:hypothetical protein